MKYVLVTLVLSIVSPSSVNSGAIPLMLTACLVRSKCSSIFMVAHQGILKSFAFFHRLGNRGSPDYKSLLFDAGQGLEGFDLRQELIPHLFGDIGSEFEENYTC